MSAPIRATPRLGDAGGVRKSGPEGEIFRPLVAVTTSSGPAGRHGLTYVSLGAQYVWAVQEPGTVPVLVTPAHDDAGIDAVLDSVNGLVLTGGEDVDPALYGQAPHPMLGPVHRERDTMELRALARARARGIPVLAICRGMQVLNVAFGGTLIQDLPSQDPGRLTHEQSAPVTRQWHHATVLAESELRRVFGVSELFINSFHHQAVDQLGAGLRATVWAEDGVVEGIEATDRESWICGVQWHPERGEAGGPGSDLRDPNRRLFWEFAHQARRYAARRQAQSGSSAQRHEVVDLV